MSDLKFGVLNYVNCLPATLGLEQGRVAAERWSILKGTPAELNQMMRDAALDVSLVSAAEYLENEEKYQLLDEFSLWCRGPVESVCLFSPFSREELAARPRCLVGVTPESATSVALTRLLLPSCRTEPFTTLESANIGLTSKRFDAVLLIGDKALQPPNWTRELKVHDLGAWWEETTELPMTFAVWVARKDLGPELLAEARGLLRSSLAWGETNRDQVLAEGCERSGLSMARVESYLDSINFKTTDASHQGLQEYRKRLKRPRIFGPPPVMIGLAL